MFGEFLVQFSRSSYVKHKSWLFVSYRCTHYECIFWHSLYVRTMQEEVPNIFQFSFIAILTNPLYILYMHGSVGVHSFLLPVLRRLPTALNAAMLVLWTAVSVTATLGGEEAARNHCVGRVDLRDHNVFITCSCLCTFDTHTHTHIHTRTCTHVHTHLVYYLHTELVRTAYVV